MWMKNDDRSHTQTTQSILTWVVAFVLAGVLAGVGTAQAATGVPGKPGEPKTVFEERFENTTHPVAINDYMGPDHWGKPMYTADKDWLPVGRGCNGWVMSPSDANPGGPCSSRDAWEHLRAMVWVLGKAQGMSDGEADSNHAVSAITNHLDQTQEAGLLIRSRKNAAKAIPGRFYAVAALFAATSCETHPQSVPALKFSLLVNGIPRPLGMGTGLCGSKPVSKNGVDVWAERLSSSAMLIEKADNLGMQVENLTATGIGNDAAFDVPQILDVTPQLDQGFQSATTQVGSVINLVYTITNTKDLKAKQGWSFSAQLPAWVKPVSAPTTTCEQGDVKTDGSKVSARGNLADGQTSCTVTVPVEVTAQGNHTLEADSIQTIRGLDMPGSASLTSIETPVSPDEGSPTGKPSATGSPGSADPKPGTVVSGPAPSPSGTTTQPQATSAGAAQPQAKTARTTPQAQTGGRALHPGIGGLIVGFSLVQAGAWLAIHRGVFAR